MASLADRVISVTGAASGIGKAFARIAADRGAKLALADIHEEPLDQLAAELRSAGVEVTATRVDVTSHVDVDGWINDTVQHFGHLDSSANIAGIFPPTMDFVDTSNELWDQVLAVNLYGVMHCVRAQLKVMQRGATIVNMASALGTNGQAGQTVYTISKHGVVGLTKSVAREIGSKGIRINAVAPGPIDTPMTQNTTPEVRQNNTNLIATGVPIPRWGQPEEVANLIAFLLSEESSFMHGHTYAVDGGLVC